MEAVGAILDRLQSLFGKGYLVGGLFPLLVALVFSAPLVWAIDPNAPYRLEDALAIPGERKAMAAIGLLLLFCFLAFLLWLTNSALRHLLEYPPLSQFGLRLQIWRYLSLQKKLGELLPNIVAFRLDADTWSEEIRTAREHATSRGTSSTRIERQTEAAYRALHLARVQGKDVSAAQMQTLRDRLIAEFEVNTAEAIPALANIADEFGVISAYAVGRAEAKLNRLTEELQTRFPMDEGAIAATDLANRALASVDRVYKRRGINIDLFWPMIEKFGRADATLSSGLEDAKLRLDFSIAMTVVWGVYSAIWIPVLLVARSHWAAFLSVALAAPFLARLWYRVSVICASGLYATMDATTELCRFDLLKALHCPLPPDSDEERALWQKITHLAELGEAAVTYQHPA